jgi:chitin disaccharide deacetylase
VRSASAMVDTPFSAAALRAAPADLGVGLHAVVPRDLAPAGVAAELRRQVDRFAALRGAPPTHLDSHQHAHARAEFLAAFLEVAAERRLPLRTLDDGMRSAARARGVDTADAFRGDAALRPCWTPRRLAEELELLPDGLTELMAHPGYRPVRARSSFAAEREVELAAVCHGRVRAAVGRLRIELCTWAAAKTPRTGE